MAQSLDDGVTSLDFKIIVVNIWLKGWHLIFLGEKVKIKIDFNKWLGVSPWQVAMSLASLVMRMTKKPLEQTQMKQFNCSARFC